MEIIIEVPDGHFCKECKWLIKPDTSNYGSGRYECKLFDGLLGNHLTDVFKHPSCIEVTKPTPERGGMFDR